jgi:iron complex outermembrane receptor protein
MSRVLVSVRKAFVTWCGVLSAAFASNAAALVKTSTPDFDEYLIPQGSLSDALSKFSAQSGVSLIFDNRIVDSRIAPPVSGWHSAREAIEMLLKDSGLSIRIINDETWVVVADTRPALLLTDAAPAPLTFMDDLSLHLDEIVVVSSYHAPSLLADEHMLYTLDENKFRFNGALNVAEPIFNLPATIASVTSANTSLLESSGGLNLADLRGFGTDRTLVLVNGRRFIRTSGGDEALFGVDLNAIPSPFVERIEIVNQSAGAELGPEAVAGAVNFVMRNDLEGVTITLDGGISEQGDATEYAASILAGTQLADGRGRITGGVSFTSEPHLFADDRPRIAEPYGFGFNGHIASSSFPGAVFAPGYGGSLITPNSRVAGVVTPSGDVDFLPLFSRPVLSPDGQSFENFDARLDQLYNWLDDYLVLPEIERIIGYGAGEFELGANHSAYAQLLVAKTDTDLQIGPLPLAIGRGGSPLYADGIVVSADNPFVPAGLVSEVESTTGETVSGLIIERRFIELGHRRHDIDRRNIQLTAGVEGELGGEWNYDVSFQYGQNKTRDKFFNFVDGERLNLSLDPAACAAAPGCTPINIFSSLSITPAQADFIRADPRNRRLTTQEKNLSLSVSGPIFENGGENAYAAFGADLRRENYRDEPEIASSSNKPLGSFFLPGGEGDLTTVELSARTSIPLAVEAPFAHSLTLDAAYRFIHTDPDGSFSNISANLQWAPVEGVELYGQVFHGGRPPTIVERFFNGSNLYSSFLDPCDFSLTTPTANTIENCMSAGPLGVTPGFSQGDGRLFSENSGNPALQEERINSRVIGAAIDVHKLAPSFPGVLTLSADWRSQRIKDYISAVNRFSAIFACYESENLSHDYCGINPATGSPFIQRDPVTRQIVELQGTLINDGNLRASGLDARMIYVLEIPGSSLIDEFSLNVLYSYNNSMKFRPSFAEEATELVGQVGFPRHNVQASASIGSEALKTVWSVRRIGSVTTNPSSNIEAFTIPPITYVDLSVQWRPREGAVFYIGAENIFDREIPIVANAPGGYFFEYYDVIGRRFFAGIKLGL